MSDLISTVPSYRTLAAITDDEARRRAWVEEYEAAHPDVFSACYSGWGGPARRDAAADAAPGLVDTILAREERMRSVVTRLPSLFAPLGIDDSGLDTVLMVGGHSSNGWSTSLHGRPTLFLALEYLTDGLGDEVLAVHEALHVVHQRHVRDAEGLRDTIALDLFYEGLAVALTRLTLPGLTDSHYLWFDDQHDDWANECRSQAEQIRAVVADNLDTPDDDPSVGGLFLNKPIDGLPTRCGYWLGDRMVSEWITGRDTPASLLDLPLHDAIGRTHAWCKGPR